MTSFLVKEALQFARQKGNKVAFDQVWHDGLIYKLYNCGVNQVILKVIIYTPI